MGEKTKSSAASYYRARYYDPQAGRFTSEDPIDFDGGINFYSYVGNNSLNQFDPTGLVICIYRSAFHTLVCISDDGSQTFVTNQVRSGYGPECMNNPSCEAQRNRGPIPVDPWYSLGQVGATPTPHNPPRVPIGRQPGRGGTPYGRGSLQLHPGGGLLSSQGCLALSPSEYQRFLKFYAIDNSGTLDVHLF